MAEEFIQVVTTAGTQEEARAIARGLIERRLAGCVQIVGPIESVFRWQGKVETADEWQCWIKARRGKFAEIEEAIRDLHTYDVPEILAMPIVEGSAAYLRWLGEATE
jgi:periplasmic divalent cation tolerance protein